MASGSPRPGSYSLLVKQLATRSQFLTDGYATRDASPLGLDELSFEFGNGRLSKESDRAPMLARQKKEWEERARAEAKAQKNQQTAEYDQMAGPQKPPKFGPAERPKRRPHRPKDENGNPLPPVGRPPGSYERGRIIVTEPDFTDSDNDD